MIFAAGILLLVLVALGTGLLTWRLLSKRRQAGQQGNIVYISKKGAYVEDSSLGGKRGALFRAMNQDEGETLFTKEGEGWGREARRGRWEIVLRSLSSGKSYQGNFSRELLLGRGVIGKTGSPAISLPFASVSRIHCRLTQREEQIWAEDLDSAYGTSVNGRKIVSQARLKDGDMIQMGTEKFLVKLRER